MSLLLALPLLGIARLLPDHGFGLWVRLAASTLVLLLPGRLASRALRVRGPSAAFAWSLTLVAAALAFTFAVHGSLGLVLVLLLVASLAAVPFQLRRPLALRPEQAPATLALVGLALGIALWANEQLVKGAGRFHLGRVRKLADFGSLSLRAVDEFKDGGLHPGYAFPLWHGWLALVAKLGGVDPAAVVLHESSLLVPLALVIAFELGRAAFRSSPAALAVVLAQLAMIALAPGAGGSYVSLGLPGTVARQLLVPAATALFLRFVRAPSWPLALTLAAAGLDLAFVHPTYARFLALPLVGFAVVRALVSTEDLRRSAVGLASFGAPVVLVFLWLLPIVRETNSHNPSAGAKSTALTTYAADLVIHSPSRYHLAPELPGRTGAIAVVSLVLVPLAALAARRRWSSLVLGGTVIVLAIELSSIVFPHFSDLVSLSQSRRAAGFVPFSLALAGGLGVLARALRLFVLPAALAAGIGLQLAYPGDFGRRLTDGGPALVTWFALIGGAAAVVAAIVIARRGMGRFERADWIVGAAAILLVFPVAVHGFTHWRPAPHRDGSALTPGVVAFLRTSVPERAVVFADLETSYRISAYAPVYVCDGPPAHVADTQANRPKERRAAVRRFLRTGSLAIPRSFGAGWVVLRTHESIRPGAHLVYRDARFRVYRL